MKRIILLPLLLLSMQLAAQTLTSVTVTIDNVSGNEGQVILTLHDESTFMKSDALQTKTSEITDGKVTITFEDVVPGDYGILAIHDKNTNGQIDMAGNGMPVEDYGVSNNPLNFGPPQWSEAKFEVNEEPLNLKIRF